MKAREIRQLTLEELRQKVDDTAEELANIKFQHALHQLDDTARVRLVRRELARLKTILREQKTGIRPLAGTASETAEG